MNWLNRNSAALQALAALMTVAVAVVALVGVKLQVDASYRVQREQSAKEIYREFLNLSITNPDLAEPNYCALSKTPKLPAYESFVTYLLYTAEQVIDMDESWAATMQQHLEVHRDYLCLAHPGEENPEALQKLLTTFKSQNCKQVSACE
jgi:hypothetical protein